MDRMANAVSLLVRFCCHFYGDHIEWTESLSIPEHIRREARDAMRNLRSNGRVIRRHKYKETYDWKNADASSRIAVKKRVYRSLSVKLKALQEQSILMDEYKANIMLQASGINVPRVILLGEHYAWGMLLESYLAMEWVDGRDVESVYAEYLGQKGVKPGRGFTRALSHFVTQLWSEGIMHGDLNPGNIYVVSREGRDGEQWSFCLLDTYPCVRIDRRSSPEFIKSCLKGMSVLVVGLWLTSPRRILPLTYFVIYTLKLLGLSRRDRRAWWPLLLSHLRHYYVNVVLRKRDRRIYSESEWYGRIDLRGIRGYFKRCPRGMQAYDDVMKFLEMKAEKSEGTIDGYGVYLKTQEKGFYLVAGEGPRLASIQSPWSIANRLYNRSLPILEPLLAIENSRMLGQRRSLVVMVGMARLIVGEIQIRAWFANLTECEISDRLGIAGESLGNSLGLLHKYNFHLDHLTADDVGLYVSHGEALVYFLSPYVIRSRESLKRAEIKEDIKRIARLCDVLSLKPPTKVRHRFMYAYIRQRNTLKQVKIHEQHAASRRHKT